MPTFALNEFALHGSATPVAPFATRVLMDRYLDAAAGLLAASDYRVQLRSHLEGWAEHLRAAPGNTGVNPTFDPAWHSEIEPGSAFWIAVSNAADTVIACMACRLFVTGSYYDLMRTGRLWYTAGRLAPVDLLLTGSGPVGRVSHSGGLWVRPEYRGAGLSWILPRMIGAVALRAWSIDYHTGIVFAGLNAKGVPDRNYGVSRNKLAIDGYFAPTGRKEMIFSVETPVADIVDRTHADVSEILAHPDKQVCDFAPITKQRRNVATIDDQPAANPSLH